MNPALVSSGGIVAGIAALYVLALALDGRAPPPAPPAPTPAPACATWRAAASVPHDVVVRAYQLLPQPNGAVFVEFWDGTWWRFLREKHPPDAHIPFWHPGVTVFQCQS